VRPDGDDDAAAHDAAADEEQQGGAAMEHQFLNAEEDRRAGDTQALAPATEEQAAGLDGVDVHQPQQQEQEEGQEEDGANPSAAQEEDQDMGEAAGGGEDDDAGGNEAKQSEPVSGAAPRKWGGGSKAAKSSSQGKPPQDQSEVQRQQEEDEAAAAAAELEAEEARRKALLDSLERSAVEDQSLPDSGTDRTAAESAAEDDKGISSSVARLALDEQDGEEAERKRLEVAAAMAGPLALEQAEELRRQLDDRLREAANGALEASASAEASLQQYGGEVWSRCEALTAGLASELTEQLRLILEPTLASKMAGDFKTGEKMGCSQYENPGGGGAQNKCGD
jgi:midasin